MLVLFGISWTRITNNENKPGEAHLYRIIGVAKNSWSMEISLQGRQLNNRN